MPCKPEGLVLAVDPNLIHKVDTNNVHNLFSMWNVFSRCADSVEQGRRLENLSWRLWNRETFCCEPQQDQPQSQFSATSAPKDISTQRRISDLPQLSGSVDSVIDEEAIELSSDCNPIDMARPKILRQDSSSRGRERHITPDRLEKMVSSIVQEKEPDLSPLPHMAMPSPAIPASASEVSGSSSTDFDEHEAASVTPASDPVCCESATTTQSDAKSDPTISGTPATTVVRGFSPSQVPTVRVTHEPKLPAQPDAIPEPSSSPAAKPVPSKKQPAKFALGGSSGDESSPASMEAHPPVPQPKRKMFQVGGSSGEDETPSLKSAMQTSRPGSLLGAQKKQAAISNTVSLYTPSDHSGSYMDESAIDDDDEDSDWEDSIEGSGKSSMDDPVTFKRVPSKPNLTSQRSLISLMFAGQDERTKALSSQASHSTPAMPHMPQRSRTMQNMSHHMLRPGQDAHDSGADAHQRPMRPSPLKPISEAPRPGPQPIMAQPQHHRQQAALSPRTTRRNMLATELTESLRRNLLWERKQKTSTANAVLQRRHTSNDVANLKQYPEKAYMPKQQPEEANASSWNQYFNRDGDGGYHAQGW